MLKRNDWNNRDHGLVTNGVMTMGTALMLSVVSVLIAAQTAFEFEDPLDEVRAQIERQAVDPARTDNGSAVSNIGSWASDTSENARDAFGNTITNAGTQVQAAADGTGMPLGQLLGLGIIGLLLLGALGYWLLARRRAKPAVLSKDRELYARGRGPERPMLNSGSRAVRGRHDQNDTENSDFDKPKKSRKSTRKGALAKVGAAAAAAGIISRDRIKNSEDDPIEEYQNDADHQAADLENPFTEAMRETADETAETDAADPSTWRRPNLDRLKTSIKEGWSGKNEEEESVSERTVPSEDDAETPFDTQDDEMRSEADTFAELFGDDDAMVADHPEATKPSVLDIMDTFEEEAHEEEQEIAKAEIPFAPTRPVVETRTPPSDPMPDALPSRNDAIRRIKALRESVNAR